MHPYVMNLTPWVIHPCFIAPVLPGETMKSAYFQARVVTDPVKSALTGWWCELYVFYVKLRDLYERADLENMVLDPQWSSAPITTAQGGTAARRPSYYAGGAGMINWVELARRRVVDEWFRDEQQDWNDHTVVVDAVNEPVAKLGQSKCVRLHPSGCRPDGRRCRDYGRR